MKVFDAKPLVIEPTVPAPSRVYVASVVVP